MESLPCNILKIDPKLQHRKIESETILHYADLYRNGIKLPPVEVVSDGEEYYLWDGFHRLQAALSAGLTHINANVVKGNYRTAQWLSFSANSKHGLPRPVASVKSILEYIFNDKEWVAKTTQEKIAEHVGVSRALVAKYFLEFTKVADDELDFHAEDDENDDSGQEESDIVTGNNMGTDDSEIPEPKSDDSDDSDVKDRRKEGYDYLGQKLPEGLREDFNKIRCVNNISVAINKQVAIVRKLVKSGDSLFTHFPETQFFVDIRNALSALRFSKPYALCPYCHGNPLTRKNCKACKRAGWMNKQTYELVPGELK